MGVVIRPGHLPTMHKRKTETGLRLSGSGMHVDDPRHEVVIGVQKTRDYEDNTSPIERIDMGCRQREKFGLNEPEEEIEERNRTLRRQYNL